MGAWIFILFLVVVFLNQPKAVPSRRRKKKGGRYAFRWSSDGLRGKRIGDRLRRENGQFV